MSDFDDRMAQLKARFLIRAEEERGELVLAAQAMDRGEIRRLAHGLSGSAGVFGFPQISLDAQAVEEAVDDGKEEPELRRLCSVLIENLAKCLQPH